MNIKVSCKKEKNKTKIKPRGNNQQSPGVNFPAQEYKLTADHLSVPGDSTAQDHTVDHAQIITMATLMHHAKDVEFVLEDLFDGLRAGLH